MHELIAIEPALAGGPTAAEIDATMAYAEAEKAASTRETYAADWRDFAALRAGVAMRGVGRWRSGTASAR
jgi:hypothetical protein